MIDLVFILNALIIFGLVASAVFAVHFDKLLPSVIALSATGIFAAAEFLLLHAPDVAISSAAQTPTARNMARQTQIRNFFIYRRLPVFF